MDHARGVRHDFHPALARALSGVLRSGSRCGHFNAKVVRAGQGGDSTKVAAGSSWFTTQGSQGADSAERTTVRPSCGAYSDGMAWHGTARRGTAWHGGAWCTIAVQAERDSGSFGRRLTRADANRTDQVTGTRQRDPSTAARQPGSDVKQ